MIRVIMRWLISFRLLVHNLSLLSRYKKAEESCMTKFIWSWETWPLLLYRYLCGCRLPFRSHTYILTVSMFFYLRWLNRRQAKRRAALARGLPEELEDMSVMTIEEAIIQDQKIGSADAGERAELKPNCMIMRLTIQWIWSGWFYLDNGWWECPFYLGMQRL